MNRKIFWAILVLAFVLRFYKLGQIPLSLDWDENSNAYNAYSILKTGKDEYGTFLPITNRSFEDYKPPAYMYLNIPTVAIFGLTPFAARLPSAIFGFLTVPAIYFLVKKLFEKSNVSGQLSVVKSESIALLSMFLLAVSPWHLQFSRAAFEANVALTIVLAGATLLLYGLRNRMLAFLSTPFLAFSIYFYYSPRIFVPAILLCFAFIFRKEIIQNLKYYVPGSILALVILIPIIQQIISREGLKRVKEVSVFEDRSLITTYVDAKSKYHVPLENIFLNRRIPLTFEILHNYSSHFSPGFLFFGDDPNPRHRSAFHGNLYIFEIPLVLLGLWLLLKNKDSKIKYFLLAWLFLAPIPAAVARETPHALRSLLMLPPLVITSSLGLTYLKGKFLRTVAFTILIIFLVNYLYSYYIIYPQKDNLSWAYGYKQMFKTVSILQDNFDRVIVTGYYWKPYIFYLFYNKTDPRFYQPTSTQESIGKFRFGTTGWDSGGKNLDDDLIENLKGNKTLLVISPQELETLKSKEKFLKFSTISDYSNQKSLFLIGEWQ